MTMLRFKSVTALAVIIAAALMAGCTTTGNSDKGRGGAGSGWENFRAEALPPASAPSVT